MKKIFFVISAFISCNGVGYPGNDSASKKEGNDTCYADIDYYNVRGVSPLKEKVYPFITIQDSTFKKKILFHTSKEHFFSKEFFRKDFFWVSCFDYKTDTSHIYAYEFILRDSVLIFNYADTISHLLTDVTCLSGKTVTIFLPNQGMRIKPKIENLNKVIEKAQSKYIEEFVVIDSIFQKMGKKIGRDGRVDYESTTCFHDNEKSMFWWIYFGHTQKTIDCQLHMSN